MVVGAGLPVPRAGSAASAAPPPSEWSAEVREALHLYQLGDYLAAQRLCADVLRTSRDPRLRRDAAALRAMTLMRMPARTDLLDGRARLRQLGQEEPGLLERPECHLALGLAQLGLAESASALEHLDDATTGFAARNQHDRLAAALTALAQGWARHTEWEVTPPRFGVAQPQSPERAREIRREQIGRVRERLAGVRNSEDALARVDLILAEDFIAAGDRTADGLRVLEQLAAAPRVTPAVADAIVKLAQHHERQERWPEALALYRRLAAEAPAQRAGQAQDRMAEIARPRLKLEVPASVYTGQPVRLRLEVRNLEAVQVEVRRVELGTWLAGRQGRFAEALLPVAGAVQLARRLDTRAEQELAWWRSDALAEPLEFQAAPGAYVVIVRAEGREPALRPTKRLVIVSDLTATGFVGSQQALLWAVTPAGWEGPPPTARFWMHGSFVPTEPQFEGGIARFALPPEVHVLRDKRWVCLVQAGAHLALCRGKLRPKDAARTPPAIALVGGPPEPKVGQTLWLAGLVLRGSGAAESLEEPGPWQLEVRGTAGHMVATLPLEPSPAGVFSARLPVTRELANRHLSVVAHRGGQVVEIVQGRFGVRVPPDAAHDLEIDCRLPPPLGPEVDQMPVHVRAWYPWGTALGGARVRPIGRTVHLPTSAVGDGLQTSQPRLLPTPEMARRGNEPHEPYEERYPRKMFLDEYGAADFVVPLGRFDFSDGPLAVEVRVGVAGWEDRQGYGYAETLRGAGQVHAWLTHAPADPQAGDEVCFRLGWYDPAGRTGVDRPRLELLRDGLPPVPLALRADVGALASVAWRPETGGTYQAVAEIPRLNGEPIRVSRTVQVRPRERGAGADEPRLRCEAWLAERAGEPGVRVRLAGRVPQPVVMLVEAVEPLAARALPGIAGSAEVFLPLERAPSEARVVVAAVGEAGTEVLADAAVQPDPAQALTLTLDPPAASPLPGDTVTVGVGCTRSGAPATDATLLARLVPAVDTGSLRWQVRQSRSPSRPIAPGPVVASSRARVPLPTKKPTLAGARLERAPLPPPLAAALYEGTTLWTDTRTVSSGSTELQVPLPGAPGLYRLIVLARAPGGAPATDALLLDTSRGLRVVADAPEQLAVGDRTVVAVMLANRQTEPAAVAVRIEPGAGLEAQALRVGDQTRAINSAALAEGVPVVVPAGQRVWLQLRVEAIRVGLATLRAEVEGPAGRQHTETTYEVVSAEPAEPTETPPDRLHLKRTLLWVMEQRVRLDPVTGEVSEDGVWKTLRQHVVPAPGDRIPPGRKVLVREEFTLEQPLTTVTWSQRAPSNCHAMQTSPSRQLSADALRSCGLQLLCAGRHTLAARRHTREYEIVAVRPGVCRLPPPEVYADGRRLLVTVEPAEILLNVTGTP